ncbi:hypothetical protein KPP03845_200002 (plasmid) [Streptomyces xanthophaeus]|nr:hypothetical protein KPP03845_200002 [Streptomyces xanthophaeus]
MPWWAPTRQAQPQAHTHKEPYASIILSFTRKSLTLRNGRPGKTWRLATPSGRIRSAPPPKALRLRLQDQHPRHPVPKQQTAPGTGLEWPVPGAVRDLDGRQAMLKEKGVSSRLKSFEAYAKTVTEFAAGHIADLAVCGLAIIPPLLGVTCTTDFVTSISGATVTQ